VEGAAAEVKAREAAAARREADAARREAELGGAAEALRRREEAAAAAAAEHARMDAALGARKLEAAELQVPRPPPAARCCGAAGPAPALGARSPCADRTVGASPVRVQQRPRPSHAVAPPPAACPSSRTCAAGGLR